MEGEKGGGDGTRAFSGFQFGEKKGGPREERVRVCGPVPVRHVSVPGGFRCDFVVSCLASCSGSF